MELSYAADDFPAIARRMREIAEERQKAGKDQQRPIEGRRNGLERLRYGPSHTNCSRGNGTR